MNIDLAKQKARQVFDSWFSIFGSAPDHEIKEKLFEYFFSGYLAGTKYTEEIKNQVKCPNINLDDVNRNFDL